MRERRPEDWRVDLAQRHPLEAAVGRALGAHSRLMLLRSSAAATDRLDYQILGPGDRLVELELKAKRQRYAGWGALRPEVAERDLFVLDELALRRIIDGGRYAFLLVRDLPQDRWCTWSSTELTLASKVRTARKLASAGGHTKGKILLDLGEAAATAASLAEALDTIADVLPVIDRQWNDITPWPWGRPQGA